MSSKKFSRETDKENERKAWEFLLDRWGYKVEPTPDDFFFYDGTVFLEGTKIGLVEFKERDRSETMKTVLISCYKLKNLKDCSMEEEVPAYYMVKSLEGNYWIINVDDIDETRVFLGGREPREGATRDKELCIDIPFEEMTKIAPDA